MKNKKRVLTIILILIVVIAMILAVVLIYGNVKDKQLDEYYTEVEDSACRMASEQNYTEALWNAFEKLRKISFTDLVNGEYIEDIENPVTRKKLSELTNGYVSIDWVDGEMICTYKEG